MSKGPDAFRTISEVAEELDLPQHVLRFWETRFAQIKPMKRGGGRRYYRPDDVELLRGIRRLLYGEGYTIKGVQRILKEQGLRHVIAAGQGFGLDPAPEGDEADDFSGEVAEDLDFDSGADDDFDEPEQQDSDRDTDGRREPVFGSRATHPDRHADAPAVRVSVDRQQHEPSFGGRAHEPSPAPSRIPTAPPDLPSSADDYLPPLVADLPMPPERGGASSRAESIYAPPQPATRREPGMTSTRPHMASAEPGDYEPAPARAAERAVAAPSQPALGHGDRERLQATLMELLECKRILDNVR